MQLQVTIANATDQSILPTTNASAELEKAGSAHAENDKNKQNDNEQSNQWVVFAILAVGIFMATLDTSIVNISLPTIAHFFVVPLSGAVEWVIIAYLLVSAGVLLTVGRLADSIGRKPIWVAGLIIFTAGSALSGASVSLGMLIAARALVIVEQLVSNPIIDVVLLRSRVFLSANVSLILSFLALFAVSFMLPFYLEALRGYSTLQAGLLALGRELLLAIGEDPEREGLRETPRRWADAWREFMEYDPGTTETTFASTSTDQIVCVSGIRVWSLCEHHLCLEHISWQPYAYSIEIRLETCSKQSTIEARVRNIALPQKDEGGV